MRRKGLERRSKKYAPVQNVSVGNWYMDAEDFHQKYKTGRIGVKKRMSPAAGVKNRMIIYGPKTDGTYIVEFRSQMVRRWRSACPQARPACSSISRSGCPMSYSCPTFHKEPLSRLRCFQAGALSRDLSPRTNESSRDPALKRRAGFSFGRPPYKCRIKLAQSWLLELS
jgi:hypothetical protein